MPDSPEVADGVDRNPESFNNGVPSGIESKAVYEQALREALAAHDKEYLMDYFRNEDIDKLFDAYKGLQSDAYRERLAKMVVGKERIAKPAVFKPKEKELPAMRQKFIPVRSYERKGERVKGYTKGFFSWKDAPLATRYLRNNIKESNAVLRAELRNKFRVVVSEISIRDKKYRLAGKKK